LKKEGSKEEWNRSERQVGLLRRLGPVHPKPAKAKNVKLPNEPICHSRPNLPVNNLQQFHRKSAPKRTHFAPSNCAIPTYSNPCGGGYTAGEIRNSQPRTERRLSVGFACGVARGLIYARSRLKIRNVGLPITIDQITRHQTKSKSQI
jgi:hypothetical protein